MSDSVNRFQGIPGSFEFGLVASARDLRKNGTTTRFPELLFRLLTLLTQRSGEVVTQEDIRCML
jgi:DNA-binding winged helix-turn-helix (wHTH) protein